MLLITELTEDVKTVIAEDASGKKNFYVEGIIMQSEIKNKNGRWYPKPVMESALGRYINEKVVTGRGWGELDHPSGPKINPANVSHRFVDIQWQGNDVYGKAIVLDEGPGRMVRALHECGGSFGMSSRGLGTIKQNQQGIMEVQSDFYIATPGDIVLDPSAPSAFVNGIMENVQWLMKEENGELYLQAIEDTKKSLKKMSLEEISNKKVAIFEKFLRENFS